MNTQTDRISAVELENTPRWVRDELHELSRRLDALERPALTPARAETERPHDGDRSDHPPLPTRP